MTDVVTHRDGEAGSSVVQQGNVTSQAPPWTAVSGTLRLTQLRVLRDGLQIQRLHRAHRDDRLVVEQRGPV